MDPPTTITGSLEGMDHDAGIAMEAGWESSRVGCEEAGVKGGGPPSRVIPSVMTGGVSAATAFPAPPASEAPQFVQVTAPEELRVLQCGQSITEPLFCPLKLLRLCVSHLEIKACGIAGCSRNTANNLRMMRSWLPGQDSNLQPFG